MFTSLVLYFSIFALSMERTRLSFHCWLYNLCIVVYVTNKTWNLKLETWNLIRQIFSALPLTLLSSGGQKDEAHFTACYSLTVDNMLI